VKLRGLMWFLGSILYDIEERFPDRGFGKMFIDIVRSSSRAVLDRFYWVLCP